MTVPMRDRIEIRKRLPASPEAVFDAWTDPASLAAWMTPVGRAQVELDLRIGGTFRIVMIGEGREIEHTGRYLEIDPPRRLVFTWQSPYTGRAPSRVTLTVARAGSTSELTLVHEELPPDAGISHEGGWSQILERLAGHLAPSTER